MKVYKDSLYVGGTEWKRVDRFTYRSDEYNISVNVKGHMHDPEEVIFDYLMHQNNNPAVKVIDWNDPVYSISSKGYYEFICSELCVYSDDFNPIGCQGSFSEIANAMWLIPFNFVLCEDRNKIENVRKIRLDFAQLYSNYDNYDAIDSRMPINVLEMLYAIGLIGQDESTKQFDTHDSWSSDFLKVYFRTIISNLGLQDMTDDVISDERALGMLGDVTPLLKVYSTIECANNREYDEHGIGGFFPDPTTKRDLRTKNLVWQMRQYIEQITFQTVIADNDY